MKVGLSHEGVTAEKHKERVFQDKSRKRKTLLTFPSPERSEAGVAYARQFVFHVINTLSQPLMTGTLFLFI